MKKIRYFIMCVAATGLLFSCSGKKEIKEANYEVVPLPSEITTENGASFTLSKATKIVFRENEKCNAMPVSGRIFGNRHRDQV